jgi:dTDP-4-amino-4,6-dideoxygalactose transaminase
MHVFSIPRHQIETTFGDYVRIAGSLVAPGDREEVTRRFEADFARYVGCRHAIAVSSGRLGLHLLLEALGLDAGDEVIIPSFNLSAVVERFCQLGLVPRFCDIRREDLNVDPVAAERSVTPQTKAILATHMFGHPANMTALTDLARRKNLILLEDCAHALGATHNDRMVGTFGSGAIFSFSVLKLVTTFGGGMVTTNDDAIAGAIRQRIRTIRATKPAPKALGKAITGTIMDVGTRRWVFSFGAWPVLRLARMIRPDFQRKMMTETPRKDRSFRPETVPPMHPFQARLGISQLRRVEEFIDRRRQVERWLGEELCNIPQITPLVSDENGRSNGLYFGILAERAEALAQHLFRRGIDCETSEYLNCADLEMYADTFTDCPVAREVQSKILRLPNYPNLSRRAVARIAREVRRFYA